MVINIENGMEQTKENIDLMKKNSLEEFLLKYGLSSFEVYEVIFNDFHQPLLIYMKNNFYGASKIKLQYDDHRRLFKAIGYRENLESPFARDIAITIFAYDERGNKVEERNFTQGRKLIKALYEDNPITKYVYNEHDQLIEEWSLNENGELREEFAIFKFCYDEAGSQQDLGWYNLRGEKEGIK